MKKQMCIIHNLSEDNLLHANELGGLVNPSLAITLNNNLLNGFGEITLIKDPDNFNVSEHNVYNCDVYSSRMPVLQYRLREDLLSTLNTEITAAFDYFNIEARNADMIYKENGDNSLFTQGKQKALQSLEKNMSMMMLYAMEKNMPLKIKDKDIIIPYKFVSLADMKTIKLNSKGILDDDDLNDFFVKSLQKSFKKNITKYLKSDKTLEKCDFQAELDYLYNDANNIFYKNKDTEKSTMHFATFHKFKVFIENTDLDKKPIDFSHLKDTLEKKIFTNPKKIMEYKEWLSNEIDCVCENPFFEVQVANSWNYKKIDATTDNLSKYMNKKVRNGEKTGFVNNVGDIRSVVCHQLKSIAEIKKNIGTLVTDDEFKQIAKNSSDELSNLGADMGHYFKFSATGMQYTDAYSNVIKMYAKNRSTSTLLESFDFGDDLDEYKNRIDDFLDGMIKMSAPYFEAKSKKVCSLSEFSVALVPKTTSKKAISLLKNEGLKVTIYDPNKELSRVASLNRHSNLFFGDGGEIKFDKSKQDSIESTPNI